MADWGIKVTEPGYDVATATDLNISLKSDLTLLKVFAQGSVNMSGDQTIAHSLGYIPQFLVYVYNGSKTIMATGNIGFAVARSDTSNLYIKDTAYGGDATSARYYIFYEQA